MTGRHLAAVSRPLETVSEVMPSYVSAALRLKGDELLALVYDYHASWSPTTRALTLVPREEWVARFRALVGPEGHKFKRHPGPGHVITLWRGTQREEHKTGLSWTPKRTYAQAFASVVPDGQVWRIDSVPLSAVLYYDPDELPTVAPELLIDTTGLDIVRES